MRSAVCIASYFSQSVRQNRSLLGICYGCRFIHSSIILIGRILLHFNAKCVLLWYSSFAPVDNKFDAAHLACLCVYDCAWCVHCMEQIMPQSHFSWACTYHKWCMHSIELEASSFKLYTFKPQMITIYKALTMVYRTAEGTQIPTKVMCWCKVIGKSTFYDMFEFEAWNST